MHGRGAFPNSDAFWSFVCDELGPGVWIGKACEILSSKCIGPEPPSGRCFGVDRVLSGLAYDHHAQRLRVACKACNKWAARQEMHAAGHAAAAQH